MSTYQDAELSPEEVAVLEEIEKLIGEPIPYEGPMPYGDPLEEDSEWDGENPGVDSDAYGSNGGDDFFIVFGFRTRHGHVTELGLSDKNLTHLPESFGNLKWLHILGLEKNRLTQLPTSITEIPELYSVLLCDNLLKTLPPGFTVHRGDPFGVFDDNGTKLDLRHNPSELKSLSVLLNLDHVALSYRFPDEIWLHQSQDEYDKLYMRIPSELLHHPILHRLDFSSLKILKEPCPQCHNHEVLTGEMNTTKQVLTFCPHCEHEIS